MALKIPRRAARVVRDGLRLILRTAMVAGLLQVQFDALSAGAATSGDQPLTPPAAGTVNRLAQVRQLVLMPTATNEMVDLEATVAGIFPEFSLVVLHDDTGNAGITLDLDRFSRLKTRQRIRLQGLAHVRNGEASLLPLKLIDNDGLHGAQETSGRLYLSEGMHPFWLGYFQFVREQVLKVEYEGPDIRRCILPREALFHAANSATEETRCEPGLNFDCYEGFWDGVPDFRQLEPIKSGITGDISLEARRRDDYFALRFAGLLEIKKPGDYIFHLTSDDGSQLFLQEIPTSVKILSDHDSGQTNVAQPLDMGQLLTKDKDYLWSAVEGTVTFIGRTAKGWNLEISSGGGLMNVYCNQAASLPAGLVNDCRIRATGYCQGVVNEQGQLVPGRLLVPTTNDISLLAPESDQKATNQGAAEPLPVLTTAEQIRHLKPEEAARAFPVRLRGIITARKVIPEGIIQDRAAAVYVRFQLPENRQPAVGNYCELGGVTAPGGFAALVIASQATDLGPGKYPSPLHPDYAQLLDGSMDCQWVEVQGLVRQVEPQEHKVHLVVKGGELQALIQVNANLNCIESLSNAFVRIRGCVIPGRNESGHKTKEVYLFVPALSCLAVDQAAAADPFQAPLKQVSELSLFDPNPNYYQMTRVRGQALLVADKLVYFTDGASNLRIIPKDPAQVAAGDLVEAVGLPEAGAFSPLLIEAMIRKTGHANLPAPPLASFEQISQPDYDAHWVRIEGRLIEIRTEMNRVVLQLQSGLRNLRAVGPANRLSAVIPTPGSRLSLCGVVVQTQEGQVGNAGVAELQLNSPADIICLQLPPFWTPQRTLLMIAVLITVVLLAGLWIYLLRRTVAKRTQALRLEMDEREAAEEKVRALQTENALEAQRARIARNIHDDLGARATKLSLLASQHPGSEIDLQAQLNEISLTSRQMIEALDETVWTINPVNDTLPRLANYITHFAEDFFRGTGIFCQMEIPVGLPDLPLTAEFRFNLFLVVKEALNNALKHSGGRTVLLKILLKPGQLELTVRDDGRGFASNAAEPGNGLKNLRNRVQSLGGQITIESAPGAGTEIHTCLPLRAPENQSDL